MRLILFFLVAVFVLGCTSCTSPHKDVVRTFSVVDGCQYTLEKGAWLYYHSESCTNCAAQSRR